MTGAHQGVSSETEGMSAHARLGGLLAALVALALVFIAGGVIGTDEIRGWVEPLGPWGPLLYVPLAALLGTALVPAAALAAAAGLLFGVWTGAAASIAAGTCAALLSRWLSRRAGHEAFEEVANDRVREVGDFAREHGFLAVVVARLAPWLPDGPVNHAFGIAGLTAVAVAAGHLVAAGPRALAYATVGANSDDPTGGDALIGWGINIATGVVGAVLLFLVIRHRRRARASNLTHEATPT